VEGDDEAASLPPPAPRVASEPPLGTGTMLAQRYQLVAPLDAGGHGLVWRARDTVLGEDVAVKFLPTVSPQQRARARREIALLRRLRVPGVVALRDEGEHGALTFLAMDLVAGEPFPAGRTVWGELAPTVVALLETLARIHTAGVVHRDLKPGNVLVAPDGRPTVLDFGISWDDLEDGLTRTGQILGTPAYLAPEQVDGGAITPRTDLYALGVMLYEALAGEHPHGDRAGEAVLAMRQFGPPMPLGRLAPTVPPTVCALVDALLAPVPSDRPRAAPDALARLRGEPAALATTRGALAWLDVPCLEALCAHVEAGRAVDLFGPPGAGRTSTLRRLADALIDRGGKVLWASASTRPFGALEALVGGLDDLYSQGFADVAAAVRTGLRGLLSGGAALLVDDYDSLDPPSAALLADCLDAGAIVRVRNDPDGHAPIDPRAAVVRLEPFSAEALRPLFAGPSRLFHLPEDAAGALHARTGGLVARVTEELNAWVRAGLARWQGTQIMVEPEGLAALRGRPGSLRLSDARPALVPGLSSTQVAQLLRWVQFAWPHATLPLLQHLTHEPRWRLEATLHTLAQQGHLQRGPDGDWRLTAAPPAENWPTRQRVAAHAALADALPPGAHGRLHHLLAGATTPCPPGFAARVSAEAGARVDVLLARGGLAEALGLLAESLGALRALRDDVESAPAVVDEALDAEVVLLGRLVEASVIDGTARALDRARYALSRYPRPSLLVAQLSGLAQAARALRQSGEEALHRAADVAPFHDPALERRRLGVWVMAHNRGPAEDEAEAVAIAVAAMQRLGDPESLALAQLWGARERFRVGAFDEAARACANPPADAWATTRIELKVYAASAWMEAFDLPSAATLADEAQAEAAALRLPYLEARAARVLRAARYRAGEALSPDPGLLEAAPYLEAFTVEALLVSTEAAIAWRAQQWSDARTLALRARALWASAAWPTGELFADCLAVAASPKSALPQWDGLVAQCLTLLPLRTAAECLGLLGTVRPLPARARMALIDWAETVPTTHRHARLEVLSAEEILSPVCQTPDAPRVS
jgi:hypothetical protein